MAKKMDHNLESLAQSWGNKIESGLSAADKQALIAWCNQDRHNYHTLLKHANTAKCRSEIQSLPGLFPEKETKAQTLSRQAFIVFACLVIALSAISWAFHFNPLSLFDNPEQKFEQNKRLITQRGEQQQYVLSDGSILYLNTDTIVTINFDKSQRQLNLVKGEAKFSVERDIDRPFTVTTGNQAFTALGTVFNLERIADDHMELVVTDGQVLITQASDEQEITAELFSTKEQNLPGLLINANDSAIKAVINNNIHEPLQSLSVDQVQSDLSWQQGVLIFNGEELPAVLEEIERYNTLTFEIADESLNSLRISGYFKTGNTKEILHLLKFSFNIDYQIKADNTVILSHSETTS